MGRQLSALGLDPGLVIEPVHSRSLSRRSQKRERSPDRGDNGGGDAMDVVMDQSN